MARFLLLNGPNLNLLGIREPGVYGHQGLDGIVAMLQQQAQGQGHQLDAFQSNAEHALIDRIHAAREEGVDCILISPGGLTHTRVALRDALLAVGIPFIEVHLSNTFTRERFRHRSYLSDVAAGVIIGLGPHGYTLALEAAIHQTTLS